LLGLGEGGLVPIPRTPKINLGLPLEEADLEFEQLQELEQELEGAQIQEDKNRETLFGESLPFLRDFTGRASTVIDDRKIRKLLASNDNLYDIPETWRGSIYRYWEKQINKDCLAGLKPLLAEYKRIIDNAKVMKVGRNLENLHLHST
jgi:helicase required for RNAi-mediated heterochromatin assembly 1